MNPNKSSSQNQRNRIPKGWGGKLFALIDGNLPLFIFSVIYYCIIFFLTSNLNIWEDEVYTLNTTSGTLAYALRQSFDFELQPPVYFLLLTIWRLISESLIWAKLFSVIIIAITQISLYNFLKRISNTKIAFFSTILFLINPYTIFSILEMRMYSLVLLLSLLLIVQFFNTYYFGNISSRSRIIYTILTILGLFTQYYLGFLLVAVAAVLLFEKKYKSFRIYLLDMIIPLLMVSLVVSKVLLSFELHSGHLIDEQMTSPTFFNEIKGVIAGYVFEYIYPVDFFGPESTLDWIVRVALIVLFLLSTNLKELLKGFDSIFPIVIIICVLIVFIIFTGYLIGTYFIAFKRTAFLVMPLLLMISLLLKFVKSKYLYYWIALFVLIFLQRSIDNNKNLSKMIDFRSLGSYIECSENVNEPIFVYRNILSENLAFYYHGINELIPVPEPFKFEHYSMDEWIVNSDDICNLKNKTSSVSQFFFIIDTFPLKGVDESKLLLLEFLLQNYTLEEEKWYNSRIVLYQFSKTVK